MKLQLYSRDNTVNPGRFSGDVTVLGSAFGPYGIDMIEHSGICEQGPVRPNNEDYIAHRCPEETTVRESKGHLFVIADGVGGNLAGEVASKEASESLLRNYYSSSKTGGKALQEAFHLANMHVYDLSHTSPEYRRMQTTLSAIVLLDRKAFIGHVGDSRIYLARGGEIKQMTRDHSEVGELARLQIITQEEARRHYRRNIITRSVGSDPFMKVDFSSIEVELGDIFILCTDGVWEPVEDKDFALIVEKNSPSIACRMLLDLAIKRKTNDNLSIQVVKVVEWERNETENTPRKPSLLKRSLQLFDKFTKR